MESKIVCQQIQANKRKTKKTHNVDKSIPKAFPMRSLILLNRFSTAVHSTVTHTHTHTNMLQMNHYKIKLRYKCDCLLEIKTPIYK